MEVSGVLYAGQRGLQLMGHVGGKLLPHFILFVVLALHFLNILGDLLVLFLQPLSQRLQFFVDLGLHRIFQIDLINGFRDRPGNVACKEQCQNGGASHNREDGGNGMPQNSPHIVAGSGKPEYIPILQLGSRIHALPG